MEGVRREHLGSAYMEEPRRGHADTGEEMEVAAVGVRGRGRWDSRSTSRPAFMVSKAADAAVWEDLKDIKPPMYDGNPLNLDRFLEKLDDWGVTVTEDMDPADAEKYVFRQFRYRLPEVFQELYFVATKEGKIKTLKGAKIWLNEQERVDAPQVVTRSRRGRATGRCGGHAQVSRQAKHYAHRGINALMSCDKAFQDPCHSATRERKYVQQHIRICTHGVKSGLE